MLIPSSQFQKCTPFLPFHKDIHISKRTRAAIKIQFYPISNFSKPKYTNLSQKTDQSSSHIPNAEQKLSNFNLQTQKTRGNHRSKKGDPNSKGYVSSIYPCPILLSIISSSMSYIRFVPLLLSALVGVDRWTGRLP
jgi:hypothetical protein